MRTTLTNKWTFQFINTGGHTKIIELYMTLSEKLKKIEKFRECNANLLTSGHFNL